MTCGQKKGLQGELQGSTQVHQLFVVRSCARCDRHKSPARSPFFITVDEGIVHNHLCPLGIKSKSHLMHTVLRKRLPDRLLAGLFAIKEQEPASSRTSDLASLG